MLKNIYQFSKEELIGLLKESFPMNLYLYMEEMILFIAAQNTMVDPNMQYNMIYTDSLFSLSYVPSFYLRICLKAFFSKSPLRKTLWLWLQTKKVFSSDSMDFRSLDITKELKYRNHGWMGIMHNSTKHCAKMRNLVFAGTEIFLPLFLRHLIWKLITMVDSVRKHQAPLGKVEPWIDWEMHYFLALIKF